MVFGSRGEETAPGGMWILGVFGGVRLHTYTCLVPCSGLLASVEVLVFIGLPSAQGGVLVIVDVVILVGF